MIKLGCNFLSSCAPRDADLKVGAKKADHWLWMKVVANYVAMTPDGRVVDSSLDKGRPYDLRIGAGQVTNHPFSLNWSSELCSLRKTRHCSQC